MALFSKILAKIRGGSASESDWDELRKSLIESDIGAALSEELIVAAQSYKGDDPVSAITSALRGALTDASRELAFTGTRPTTVLVVGVNGTGKTTSVAKLM